MHRAIVAGVVGEATRGGLTRREDAAADRDAAGHLGLALSVTSLWNPGLGLGTVLAKIKRPPRRLGRVSLGFGRRRTRRRERLAKCTVKWGQFSRRLPLHNRARVRAARR